MIEKLLDEHGIIKDDWTDLKHIHSIVLNQGSNIIMIRTAMMFKFDMAKELLYITYGQTKDGVFRDLKNNTSDFEIMTYVSFDNINGIIESNYVGYYGTSYQKDFPKR